MKLVEVHKLCDLSWQFAQFVAAQVKLVEVHKLCNLSGQFAQLIHAQVKRG